MPHISQKLSGDVTKSTWRASILLSQQFCVISTTLFRLAFKPRKVLSLMVMIITCYKSIQYRVKLILRKPKNKRETLTSIYSHTLIHLKMNGYFKRHTCSSTCSFIVDLERTQTTYPVLQRSSGLFNLSYILDRVLLRSAIASHSVFILAGWKWPENFTSTQSLRRHFVYLRCKISRKGLGISYQRDLGTRLHLLIKPIDESYHGAPESQNLVVPGHRSCCNDVSLRI